MPSPVMGSSPTPARVLFTPNLFFGGGDTGIVYDTRYGEYVQSGKRVDFTLTISLTDKGSSTGGATIALPVTASSTVNLNQVIGDVRPDGLVSVTGQVVATIFPSTNTVMSLEIKNNGAVTGAMTHANFDGSCSLIISGHYFVD